MAEACALLGDLAGAYHHLEELDRRRPPGFRPPRTGGAVWTAAAGGELRRAREIAWEAAGDHAEHGAAVPQAQSLYDIARLGSPEEVVAELDALTVRCQGALVPALARAARGLAEDDADGLDALSAELEEMGFVLFAAELATKASALHRRSGRRGSGWAAARRAAELIGRCEGARTPLLAERDEAGGLTEREWEVATLVARGLTDREVAERLHVSVRTVHSHLHHTYRKLGISGRDELAQLLG
jgi:ATP/maltotriose-dependent transcriptional regulator MalT